MFLSPSNSISGAPSLLRHKFRIPNTTEKITILQIDANTLTPPVTGLANMSVPLRLKSSDWGKKASINASVTFPAMDGASFRKKRERMATRQSSRDRNLRQSFLSSAIGDDNH